MYTEKLINNIAEKTGIDISKFDMNELVMGMDVELEHGSSNEKTDVTDDDPIKTFKIVMAHMHEMPDYYTKLKKMEKKENISEYARRMRELAGLSEGSQNKSLKTIQEGKSSFEGGVTFMAKDFMKSNDVVEENFASPEYYEDRKSEALNYLNGLSGWVTVLYEPELGDITIYKDTSGLDTERDDIGPEEREGYMELSVDEVLEIINSDRVRVYTKENLDWRNKESQQVSEGAAWGESQFEGEFPKDDGARPDDDKFAALRLKFPDASEEELSNVYSAMQMKESKENKEEFETHKFEQKTIEEGGEDSVLYNLNENTVIVLDFLNEDEDMSAIVNNDTIANEEKMTKEMINKALMDLGISPNAPMAKQNTMYSEGFSAVEFMIQMGDMMRAEQEAEATAGKIADWMDKFGYDFN
jgi:hypothetical protein